MMKEVVRQVVADVSENATTEDSGGYTPIPIEDGMCKLPKRSCKYEEKGGWHDKSELVHREVVMNTMKQKVESESNSIVREPSNAC